MSTSWGLAATYLTGYLRAHPLWLIPYISAVLLTLTGFGILWLTEDHDGTRRRADDPDEAVAWFKAVGDEAALLEYAPAQALPRGGFPLPPPSTHDLWEPHPDVTGELSRRAGDNGAAPVPEVPQKPPAEQAAPPHVPTPGTGRRGDRFRGGSPSPDTAPEPPTLVLDYTEDDDLSESKLRAALDWKTILKMDAARGLSIADCDDGDGPGEGSPWEWHQELRAEGLAS